MKREIEDLYIYLSTCDEVLSFDNLKELNKKILEIIKKYIKGLS
ncbi:Uncharacterised protein [Bergeriella denitrificans]|uniref:Four helix bundle protein n=1 Tax=Bergeriella denitrificans TaxID=494 RepID=A0A378UI87_BERDE|nr:Uncharacterised protein [Bergeriella denitrificans]